MKISVSNLISLFGYNRFVSSQEIIDKYKNRIKGEVDNEYLIFNDVIKNTPLNKLETLYKVNNIKNYVGEVKLGEADDTKLCNLSNLTKDFIKKSDDKEVKNLFNKVYRTKVGNESEGEFCERYFGENYRSQVAVKKKGISGRLDVLYNDIVYELKCKVDGRFADICYDNYYVQVQLYLWLSDLNKGVLVQYNDLYCSECEIPRNDDFIKALENVYNEISNMTWDTIEEKIGLLKDQLETVPLLYFNEVHEY